MQVLLHIVNLTVRQTWVATEPRETARKWCAETQRAAISRRDAEREAVPEPSCGSAVRGRFQGVPGGVAQASPYASMLPVSLDHGGTEPSVASPPAM